MDSTTICLCIMLICGAFALICLAITLLTLNTTLKEINKVVQDVDTTVDKVDDLLDDVNHKLKKLEEPVTAATNIMNDGAIKTGVSTGIGVVSFILGRFLGKGKKKK